LGHSRVRLPIVGYFNEQWLFNFGPWIELVDPGKILGELIGAFLSGFVLGAVASAMYGALEAVLLSVAIGGLIGLFLFFYNLALLLDDAESLANAIGKGSILAIIMWLCGFIGSLWGSSLIH
jgi:hypothetical protein